MSAHPEFEAFKDRALRDPDVRAAHEASQERHREQERITHWRLFRLLGRLRTPDPIYYWLLDRLTDNDGWRPLFYREKRKVMRQQTLVRKFLERYSR